jgi:AAHS family 4-hydroxybenzoate transporter-like MFS transporter
VQTKARVNVSAWIDQRGVSRMQWWIFILCGLVATLDGVDLQSISFVAPVIVRQWHVNPALLGPVFSASLFGLMLGALVSGPLADRVGRKAVVTASVFAFGLFSILTAGAGSVGQLVAMRFLTGLGLGGSMPNIIALTDEYAPHSVRKTTVSTMFIGVPIGAVVAGILAARLIPAYGWQSVFIDLGGVPTLVLGFIVLFLLPESIRFLVVRAARPDRVAAVLGRLDPSAGLDADREFYLPEERRAGFPAKHLFERVNRLNTPLLWVVFFMNLLVIYFVTNWLPTVLRGAGLPLTDAIWGVVMLEGGGVVGGVLIGYIADRVNIRRVLGATFFLAAISLALIGAMHGLVPVMTMIFLAGLFAVGAQFGINALAASIYPTAVRSTGVGWAFGVGRVGSIIGPLIGGTLVAAKAGVTAIFGTAAIPAVVAALAIVLMREAEASQAVASDMTA